MANQLEDKEIIGEPPGLGTAGIPPASERRSG
jgi:hypothetical protein